MHTIELTVDMVILVQRPDGLHVLVIRRGDEPFKGENALPGGFVDAGETAEAAARRELREETNLVLTDEQADQLLKQVKTYTTPDRDPRGRVVSVAFAALLPGEDLPTVRAGDDARDARWLPVEAVLAEPMAFDHDRILWDAISQLGYSVTNLDSSVDPGWFGVLAEQALDLYGPFDTATEAAAWGHKDIDRGGPRGGWTVVRLVPTSDHPELADD